MKVLKIGDAVCDVAVALSAVLHPFFYTFIFRVQWFLLPVLGQICDCVFKKEQLDEVAWCCICRIFFLCVVEGIKLVGDS